MVYSITMKTPSLWSLLGPYAWWVVGIIIATAATSLLGLVTPRLVASAIDAYHLGSFDASQTIIGFLVVICGIIASMTIQNLLQVSASERVARDIRSRIADALSRQDVSFVERQTSAKLLTNLTSDVDGVKNFVSFGVSAIAWAIIVLTGASLMLFVINWRLALAIVAIIPIVGATFAVVFGRVGGLFKKSQEIIDRLNRVINESILGAALIRVLYSRHAEYEKFTSVNERAQSVGISILKVFASMIPIMMAVSNLGFVIVLIVGGHFTITGSMTIGELSAFNGYILVLVFPLIMIGFLGDMLARAAASWGRIAEVVYAPIVRQGGERAVSVTGAISVRDLTVTYGEKKVLNAVSFDIEPGSRVAIIGPTAAGKTQLLYAMTGLTGKTSGSVRYDGVDLDDVDQGGLRRQIGIVFQDSVMFNVSARENILFGAPTNEQDLHQAIATAELAGVIASLPDGIDTIVSERGTSLSGGQKQRMMLARALAVRPKVLFLDDFTARVDIATEEKIIENLAKQYPDLTIVSVTQKIASAQKFDRIILMMEGEILAQGTHDELLHASPEYAQMYQSQQSTNAYELHA